MSNANDLGNKAGAAQPGYFSRLGDEYLNSINQFGTGIGNTVAGPLTGDINRFAVQGIGNTIGGALNTVFSPVRAFFGSEESPQATPAQPKAPAAPKAPTPPAPATPAPPQYKYKPPFKVGDGNDDGYLTDEGWKMIEGQQKNPGPSEANFDFASDEDKELQRIREAFPTDGSNKNYKRFNGLEKEDDRSLWDKMKPYMPRLNQNMVADVKEDVANGDYWKIPSHIASRVNPVTSLWMGGPTEWPILGYPNALAREGMAYGLANAADEMGNVLGERIAEQQYPELRNKTDKTKALEEQYKALNPDQTMSGRLENSTDFFITPEEYMDSLDNGTLPNLRALGEASDSPTIGKWSGIVGDTFPESVEWMGLDLGLRGANEIGRYIEKEKEAKRLMDKWTKDWVKKQSTIDPTRVEGEEAPRLRDNGMRYYNSRYGEGSDGLVYDLETGEPVFPDFQQPRISGEPEATRLGYEPPKPPRVAEVNDLGTGSDVISMGDGFEKPYSSEIQYFHNVPDEVEVTKVPKTGAVKKAAELGKQRGGIKPGASDVGEMPMADASFNRLTNGDLTDAEVNYLVDETLKGRSANEVMEEIEAARENADTEIIRAFHGEEPEGYRKPDSGRANRAVGLRRGNRGKTTEPVIDDQTISMDEALEKINGKQIQGDEPVFYGKPISENMADEAARSSAKELTDFHKLPDEFTPESKPINTERANKAVENRRTSRGKGLKEGNADEAEMPMADAARKRMSGEGNSFRINEDGRPERVKKPETKPAKPEAKPTPKAPEAKAPEAKAPEQKPQQPAKQLTPQEIQARDNAKLKFRASVGQRHSGARKALETVDAISERYPNTKDMIVDYILTGNDHGIVKSIESINAGTFKIKGPQAEELKNALMQVVKIRNDVQSGAIPNWFAGKLKKYSKL